MTPSSILEDVRAEDRLDAALTEQLHRVHSSLAGLEPLLVEDHAVDAEVAERRLVGQVDDAGEISHAGFAQLVVDVEDVLERRTLAGGRPRDRCR